MQNRRAQERVPARFEVHFQDQKSAARAFSAFSVNMSTGGLCLRTKRVYAIGERVQMAMTVGGESFDLHAIVTWVREDAAGMRFVDVSEQDRERLTRVVHGLPR